MLIVADLLLAWWASPGLEEFSSGLTMGGAADPWPRRQLVSLGMVAPSERRDQDASDAHVCRRPCKRDAGEATHRSA